MNNEGCCENIYYSLNIHVLFHIFYIPCCWSDIVTSSGYWAEEVLLLGQAI